MRLVAKGWRSFQHYHDRRPPWIKLHRSLLDDVQFIRLPVEARAIVPLLWLLASEDDGTIDADLTDLAMRLRLPAKEVQVGVTALVAAGYFSDASNTLADVSKVVQDAPRSVSPSLSDSASEGEPEREVLASANGKPKKPRVTVDWNYPLPKEPDGFPACNPELWGPFMAIRKAKNLPMSEPVIERLREQAKAAGLHFNDIIRHCVERGHAAYYPDRERFPRR